MDPTCNPGTVHARFRKTYTSPVHTISSLIRSYRTLFDFIVYNCGKVKDLQSYYPVSPKESTGSLGSQGVRDLNLHPVSGERLAISSVLGRPDHQILNALKLGMPV